MYCHSSKVNRNGSDVPEEMLFVLRINVAMKFYSFYLFMLQWKFIHYQ